MVAAKNGGNRMPSRPLVGFRIESQFELTSDWLPESAFTETFSKRSVAIATALEGVDVPEDQEVCVVDIETNEVIWRSTDEEYR